MDLDDAQQLGVSVGRARARNGVKWQKHGPEVLPAWVADMDFDPPPPVVAALSSMLERGDLGYSMVSSRLPQAFAEWQERRHGWKPDVDRVRTFTSALHALEAALWNTTDRGDGVIVFTPIYYPFLDAIAASGRRLVDVPLEPHGWRLDPDRLASAIDPTTRMILFCNPHNPTGRVFDNEEIAAVAEVAERHDLLVITDEIWGELTHDAPHRPLAMCDERFAGRLVTLGSASKSFNLAGLRCAVAHVDHEPLNRSLESMPGHLQGAPSTLGALGTVTAWTECDEWLQRVRATIAARRDQLVERVARDLPDVTLQPPQATYLGWLDFTATRLGDDPAEQLLERGRVALSSGPKFGSGGSGFARINFATSSEILDEIIDRIATVLSDA